LPTTCRHLVLHTEMCMMNCLRFWNRALNMYEGNFAYISNLSRMYFLQLIERRSSFRSRLNPFDWPRVLSRGYCTDCPKNGAEFQTSISCGRRSIASRRAAILTILTDILSWNSGISPSTFS
jgi:hypothetical protein